MSAWAGRRVTVVADYDSFLRAASVYARHLESLGATVGYRIVFARPGQVSDAQLEGMGLRREQVSTAPMEVIATRSSLEREDVVLIALSGLRTRRFLVRLHHEFEGAPRRPITASMYPGLVFRAHLEGMTSRMGADLLLLNSPADLRSYESALAAMGLSNENAICAGLSFLPPERRGPALGSAVLFVAQPTVPVLRSERRYVLDKLIALARRYPSTTWMIRPRHRRGETTLHEDEHHYEDLLDELGTAIPENFRIVHTPLAELFARTGLCLTFSSTAALESLRLGIPTRILTDVGIHENVGTHFFAASGLCCTLDEVTPELRWIEPDAAWSADNIVAAVDRMPDVIAALDRLLEAQQRQGRALPPPYPRLAGRAPALERWLAEHEGWDSVAEVGGTTDGGILVQRLRKTARTVVRAAVDRFARLRFDRSDIRDKPRDPA